MNVSLSVRLYFFILGSPSRARPFNSCCFGVTSFSSVDDDESDESSGDRSLAFFSVLSFFLSSSAPYFLINSSISSSYVGSRSDKAIGTFV